ncbi:tannase and feruloyl esterase-domain-containing protein [Massariosphaeria phaeospora]|uniref:Carboxylic ester hydrolase n=1 Tax=Massariosphaeria phaeospora TaxID=100035 RepID=A0A7C8MI52_9PLEO|nr:tannase and feruloyl esterase-domain-containing protein [Massariosphaeria phaeospora]
MSFHQYLHLQISLLSASSSVFQLALSAHASWLESLRVPRTVSVLKPKFLYTMLNPKYVLPFLAVQSAFGKNELEPDAPLSCHESAFTPPHVPGAKIISISASSRHNVSTVSPGGIFPPLEDGDLCEVNITLNHPGTDDSVLVTVWLPSTHEQWNGRFQATGGGGFSVGLFDVILGPAIKDGYSASSTDGGHTTEGGDLSWTLNSDRTINWNLLQNFATRSLADQVYVGKAITTQFFGTKPHHSYWNGCSQGGRQGYVMARKYPELLDGILANAPAIGLSHLAMGDFWPQIAMKELATFLSNCELEYFMGKAMESCDWLDGVTDGVIEDPIACDFDPLHLVGQTIHCDGAEAEITRAMVDVVISITKGPYTPFGAPMWHGILPGTDTRMLANTTFLPNGQRSMEPFFVSEAFIKYMVLKDPSFDLSTLTMKDYFALWSQASYELDWAMNDNSPDLSGLRSAGTKLLTWHGLSDPVIVFQNTVEYRKRVELEMGGAAEVDKFYRLFLAPGVSHCGLGTGPVPKDPLAALVDWVENDEAPEILDAETTDAEGDLVTRALCAWPGKSKYMGVADPKRASSWSCVGGTERPEEEFQEAEPERAQEILGGLTDLFEGLGLGWSIG